MWIRFNYSKHKQCLSSLMWHQGMSKLTFWIYISFCNIHKSERDKLPLSTTNNVRQRHWRHKVHVLTPDLRSWHSTDDFLIIYLQFPSDLNILEQIHWSGSTANKNKIGNDAFCCHGVNERGKGFPANLFKFSWQIFLKKKLF